MEKIELIGKKLSEKVSMDDLPEIIFDKKDYDDALMNLANSCKKIKNILNDDELELYNKNKNLAVKFVARELGLMV